MQLHLNAEEFLARDWQQRPRLFRQAWPNFTDPIAAELLAGLAMEDGVDARVVKQTFANQQLQWDVAHGPFEDYEAFGEESWTLLVQAVNEWFPNVQQLLTPFRFLPSWRLDDVMVSFATPGGGVGSHLDNYDVFIIQGEGQRHWRVGERLANPNQERPHPDLQLLVDDFDAVIDAQLEPGDMLYIPAGCPHEGIAATPSLNYSIGFRAPTQTELLSQVADMLLDADEMGERYRDPVLEVPTHNFQVNTEQLTHLHQFLLKSLSTTALECTLMQAISMSKRPLPQPDIPLQADQIQVMDTQDVYLALTPGARLLQSPRGEFYAQGEQIRTNNTLSVTTLQKIAACANELELTALPSHDHDCAEVLAQLHALGVVYLIVDDGSEED